MRRLRLLACIALLASVAAPPASAFARDCSTEPRDGLICSDPELLALEQSVDARASRVAAIASPLTTLLLARDQRWFTETLANAESAAPDRALARTQMFALLQARTILLGRIRTAPVGDPAGEWANALGTAKVERRPSDILAVEIHAKVPAESDRPAACALTLEAKLRPDGWYAGRPIAAKIEKDADQGTDSDDNDEGQPKRSIDKADSSVRLRLQGNTLRVVSDGSGFCTGPDMVTGSYFAVGAAPAGSRAIVARTIAPSFACASANNLDEEEICADPELARNDAEIARLYGAALRRLDARLAIHLRNDQRAWAKENVTVAETWLHPYWDKTNFAVHQTSSMRAELATRQQERLAMLANIDETRRGLAGLWIAHDAYATIAPAKGKANTMTASGRKWETGDHKSHCEFEIDGRIVADRFKPEGDDEAPSLRRDGATLLIDGDDDKPATDARRHPDYCARLESAKARLFPVKPGAMIIGVDPDRIR